MCNRPFSLSITGLTDFAGFLKMNKQKLIPIAIIAILILVLGWTAFVWNPSDNQSTENQVLDLVEAPKGGDFTVETKDNDLSLKDLRGKVVILYFGYTRCPDICPTSLSFLTQALSQMTEEELAGTQSIFVSVDPERDNLTRLDTYTKYFHKNIIGATAEPEEVAKIAKLYGAAYQKVESNSAAGYLVDHSSYTYIIDKQGKLKYSLPHGTQAVDILKVVRELLAE
jgi:protein SCO1/2